MRPFILGPFHGFVGAMTSLTLPPITLIAGPTASGKSALALGLAAQTGAEIINADAQQIYGDLPILTAAPSPEDLRAVPHHLFGVAKATEIWSVGHWLRAALAQIADIRAQDRPVILVGGTGLYFRALTEGLADIPAVSVADRDQIEARYDDMGEAAFREDLARHDPAAAARIEQGDRQRLIRALSVMQTSGKSLSDWQADTTSALSGQDWTGVVMDMDRAMLYQRCDARLLSMIEAGVLDEVAALAARGLDAKLPALKAVGYRELAAHLRGEMDMAEALQAAQRETRRYAKRQLTWFRNQTPGWMRLSASSPDTALRQFIAQTAVLTPGA
jgi:tRNA dimethylallyltransferase